MNAGKRSDSPSLAGTVSGSLNGLTARSARRHQPSRRTSGVAIGMWRPYIATRSSSRRRRTVSSPTLGCLRRQGRASSGRRPARRVARRFARISRRGVRITSRSERRGDEIVDGGQQIGIVGEWTDERRSACLRRWDAAGDETRRRDDESRARSFGESLILKASHLAPQLDERRRRRALDATFVRDDLALRRRRREIEFHGDESLSRAWLQVLHGMLVAGVVRDDELKARCRLEELAR